MGVPLVIIHLEFRDGFSMIFPYKPYIWGYPHECRTQLGRPTPS